MYDYLVIIQSRLGSKRFPNKVMQTVGGIPMVKRVWLAAKEAMKNLNAKVIVAWPERYPDLDENNVLERFKCISKEFPSKYIIRLTADCPLLSSKDILNTIDNFMNYNRMNHYYSNHYDGHDVQILEPFILWNIHWCHKEHVIADFTTKPTGLSVNTKSDLCRVRCLAR